MRCGSWVSGFLTAVLIGALGCGRSESESPPVEVFPVTGKIVFQGKGSVDLLERGKVWFQSTSDPNVEAVGLIDQEGAFEMTTLFPDKAWRGVPAGRYKARIEVPLDDEHKPQPNLIDPKYSDYDKSKLVFTVPVSGEITITVQRPAR
jgi:hypothetical protein